MHDYLSPSNQEHNIGVGTYGTEETKMNQITDIIETELKKLGHTVYRNKPTMTLAEIVKDSNSKVVDIHVALHSNASNGKARGCEIYCHKFGGKGEKLARSIYEFLEPLTPAKDKGVKQGFNFYGEGKHMYELAKTKSPSCLIEVSFHDNIEDANWIISHKKAIALAIVAGIQKYAE
jgi:N-acetylmuramoyl-L-alanine amidase